MFVRLNSHLFSNNFYCFCSLFHTTSSTRVLLSTIFSYASYRVIMYIKAKLLISSVQLLTEMLDRERAVDNPNVGLINFLVQLIEMGPENFTFGEITQWARSFVEMFPYVLRDYDAELTDELATRGKSMLESEVTSGGVLSHTTSVETPDSGSSSSSSVKQNRLATTPWNQVSKRFLYTGVVAH